MNFTSSTVLDLSVDDEDPDMDDIIMLLLAASPVVLEGDKATTAAFLLVAFELVFAACIVWIEERERRNFG